jgi:capsid protein
MQIQKNTKLVPTHLGWFDRLIAQVSPGTARKRLMQRVMYNTSIYNLSEQGYVTNESSKRSMRGWNASANSADQDILPKKQSLSASCRDLDMNSGLAAGITNRIATNSLGLGLRLKSQIDREFLGFTGEDGKKRAQVWENTTEREWKTFSNSIFSDAELTLTVNENAGLALLNLLFSGDVFVALPGLPLPDAIYDLKIKVIEGDYVSNPNGLFSY